MNDMDDSEVKEGSMPEIPLARRAYQRNCQPGGVAV